MANTVRIGGARIDITGQDAEFQRVMRRAGKSFERQQKQMKKMQMRARALNKSLSLLKTTFATFTGFSLARAFSTSESAVIKFEQSIADLSAITGAAGKDLDFLRERAIEFGSSTTVTASAVGKAFTLVASAKPDLLESADALSEVTKNTLTLAEAAGIELTEAANSLGLTLNQFGLGAKEATRVINVLAAGSKYGAAVIPEITASLKLFGVTAKDAGIDIETSVAAVEALASVGLKGQRSGTALRNILLTLEEQSDNLRPSIVGLVDAIRNLAELKLDQPELTKLFGRENVNAAQALIANVEEFANLADKVKGTNVALEQAGIRVDTLGGDIKALASAWEALKLTLADTDWFRQSTQFITNLLNKTREAFTNEDYQALREQLFPYAFNYDIKIAEKEITNLYDKLVKLKNLRTNIIVSDTGIEKIDMQIAELETRLKSSVAEYNKLLKLGPRDSHHTQNIPQSVQIVPEINTTAIADTQRQIHDALASEAIFPGFAKQAVDEMLAFGDLEQAIEDVTAAREKDAEEAIRLQQHSLESARSMSEVYANIARDAEDSAARQQKAMEGFIHRIHIDFQNFGDTIKSVLNELLRELLKFGVTGHSDLFSGIASFFAGGAGGFSTGAGAIRGGIPTWGIAGGRADGGPVQAGRAYVVGERGRPELFVPGESGMVYPESQLQSGQSVNVNIGNLVGRIDSSDGPGVQAALAEALPAIRDVIEGDLIKMLRQPGQVRTAVFAGR